MTRVFADFPSSCSTFLKRKGGLFKKAHELSVLCAVDVAVIVFGQNKKLYTYGSKNIQEIVDNFHYAGRPGDHKGPQDFGNKDDGDDDDEDDDGAAVGPSGSRYPPMPPFPPNQPGYMAAHIANQAANGSPPPMPHGLLANNRRLTPQPHSRPSSSNEVRRRENYLAPDSRLRQQQQQSQQSPMSQNGHSYMSQAPMYSAPQAPMGPIPNQQPQQQQYENTRPHDMAPPPYYDQREAFPASYQREQEEQDRRQQHQQLHQSPPRDIRGSSPQPPLPPPPPASVQPLRAHGRTYSTLTPIDDSKSMLARQILGGSRTDAIRQESGHIPPKSVDTATMARSNMSHFAMPGAPPLHPPPTQSGSSHGQTVAQRIAVMNMGSPANPADRPSLKLQIPSEPSESGAGTGGDSAGPSVISPRPMTNGPPAGVLHLPPPSPSTVSLLSAGGAGATGPPNPFARPAIPQGSRIDTPASALPSRFMADMLDSPSNNLWLGGSGFGDGRSGPDSSILPSPLEFKMGYDLGAPPAFGMGRRDPPLGGAGPEREESELKRKPSEGEFGGESKRQRS